MDLALKRHEKEKEREEERKKMIEDMKKKAKQKEETKEVVIEWYGQIIPVDKKKVPVKKEEIQKELGLKKAKSAENAVEILKENLENIENNENTPKNDEKNENKPNNEENKKKPKFDEILVEKPREKWTKSNEEVKYNEKTDETLLGDDDYIEQMINELQDLVKKTLYFSI